jgi:mannose-6-phosphate isomerase-like protein (cupin superfamily)
MSTPSVVSKYHPLQYYKWGNNCEAWNFLEDKEASIKVEKMPPGAEEVLHYHKKVRQFFYILEGQAVFEVDAVILIVRKGDGLCIEENSQHRIMNKEEKPLEFIIYSQPSTKDDRYDIV